MYENSEYGIVILAAGTSSRLGMPKQILSYNGDTLLNNAIKAANGANVGTVVAVLGPQQKKMQEGMDVLAAPNFQYQEGIASSIRCGIKFMKERKRPVHYVILMACDQPHVDADHLSALIAKQKETGARIVASLYEGRKGVPALFERKLFPELLSLTGDTGAKHIIEKYEADTAVVPFPPGAIDIDTMEAYQALITATPGK